MSKILLILILVVGSLSTTLVKAQNAPAKKAATPKRAALFVGNGSASWLPRTDLLPSADAIEAEAKKLGVRKRNMDPFGLSTFPREDDAPVVTEDIYRATPKITLNQALQTLKINGVNLQKKEILIGGRQAAEGDVVELVFKGEVFMAQVVEVGAAQLLFRDLQRNETGVLRHDILPQLAIEPLQKIASQFESRMTPVEPKPSTKP